MLLLQSRSFLRQSFAFSALASGLVPVSALAPDPAARHILMIGDWGKEENTIGQGRVAAAMQSYARSNGLRVETLFLLGDTWYGPLPGGADDPRWKRQFEDMYPPSAFPGPAYSIMGNHDYQKMPATVNKRSAELAYAKRNTRWTVPDLWYTFDFPTHQPIMRVIALDSNVYHDHRENGVDFTLTPEEQAQELKWFAAQLDAYTTAADKPPFLVVMGHHPIFSNGPHGDHATLIKEWEPLLRQHQAHLYLAGHDHDLQHLEFEGHPTSFVCSGAGGADLYDLKINEDKRGPFADKVYGFTHLEATPTKLTLRHVDASGKVLHAFSKAQDHSITLLT